MPVNDKRFLSLYYHAKQSCVMQAHLNAVHHDHVITSHHHLLVHLPPATCQKSPDKLTFLLAISASPDNL